MNNFDFYNPTRIIFGKDRLAELNNVVPKNAKVLVTYGGGSVKKFGTLDKVLNALKGREVFEFGGIEPNPQFTTVMKAVEIVKKEKIDFLLAVGGGSVMDGTKFIALASCFDGDARDILLSPNRRSLNFTNAIALGTVCTLPATGSEMNAGGVICIDDAKLSFGNPLVFPKFSFIDPTLTMTLPDTQVANGIIDTFIHVCEQYVTYPAEGRFQDRTAEGILQTLIEVGPQTLADKENYDMRANLVWCATMGLNGLIGAGVPQDWSCHVIGHELTAMFGIDHGKTLAIMQPAIWTIRKDKKLKKLVQFAERVWKITEGTDEEKATLAIEKTRNFFESLGVKTHLSDYDIKEEQIDDIVKALENHGMTILSETGDLTLEVSRQILKEAF
ncbi:MAG: iron-containing alcohol dehydrogenase [Sarcina sp.]